MSKQNINDINQLDALQARILELECEMKAVVIRKMRTKQDIGSIKKKLNKLRTNITMLREDAPIVSLSEYRTITKELNRLVQGLQDLEVFYGYDEEKSKTMEAEKQSVLSRMAAIVAESSRVCKVLIFHGRPTNTF